MSEQNKTKNVDGVLEHIFHRILHWIERVIAVFTIGVLVVALGIEIYEVLVGKTSITDVYEYLNNILTIVVGLEFVRMLVDTTPSSILQVLTVAITRQVILNHGDPISMAVCIACIAGLFAVRRFFFRSKELKEELVDET